MPEAFPCFKTAGCIRQISKKTRSNFKFLPVYESVLGSGVRSKELSLTIMNTKYPKPFKICIVQYSNIYVFFIDYIGYILH